MGKSFKFSAFVTHHNNFVYLVDRIVGVTVVIRRVGIDGPLPLAPARAEGQLCLDHDSYSGHQKEQNEKTTHFDFGSCTYSLQLVKTKNVVRTENTQFLYPLAIITARL